LHNLAEKSVKSSYDIKSNSLPYQQCLASTTDQWKQLWCSVEVEFKKELEYIVKIAKIFTTLTASLLLAISLYAFGAVCLERHNKRQQYFNDFKRNQYQGQYQGQCQGQLQGQGYALHMQYQTPQVSYGLQANTVTYV
jgi:hypothetical protein